MEIKQLEKIAKEARKNIIEMIYHAKSGHPGGSLSITDILTVLYFEKMNVDPKNPTKQDRDRLVLSKGHAVPALYSILMEKGFIDKNLITTLRKYKSPLQGHPDMKKLNCIDMSTGSLGQGISAAVGMAISAKISNDPYRVYAIMGDGELQEGQCYEAFMAANHYKLDNLTVFIDKNGLQIDGDVEKVMSLANLKDKFKAFGFNVLEIDGHDFVQIREAIDNAINTKNMPTAIICKTVKGKGVSFMENNAGWHGKAPNKEEYENAMKELM